MREGYIRELGDVVDLPPDAAFEVISTNEKGHITYQAYLCDDAAAQLRIHLETIELQRKLGQLKEQFKNETVE